MRTAISAPVSQHVCRELKFPRRVLGAALTYLKRVYLTCCCLEQDPQQLLLTCLYLACKVMGGAARLAGSCADAASDASPAPWSNTPYTDRGALRFSG